MRCKKGEKCEILGKVGLKKVPQLGLLGKRTLDKINRTNYTLNDEEFDHLVEFHSSV